MIKKCPICGSVLSTGFNCPRCEFARSKTPEEIGREQGEKLAKKFIKMIWKERNIWRNKRSGK